MVENISRPTLFPKIRSNNIEVTKNYKICSRMLFKMTAIKFYFLMVTSYFFAEHKE